MLNNSVEWAPEKTDQTKSQSTLSHDLTKEDEERIENIFNALDLDGNGKIDIHDLSVTLKESGVSPVYAKEFLERSDQNKSGTISLKEFIHYVKEHEKTLKLVFTTFDKNQDGKLDSEELVRAFKELGVEIDLSEAVRLVQRMDTDGSLNISFNEWRDFLLYAPSHDIKELIKYWRHSSALSVGRPPIKVFIPSGGQQMSQSSVPTCSNCLKPIKMSHLLKYRTIDSSPLTVRSMSSGIGVEMELQELIRAEIHSLRKERGCNLPNSE